jgi:hypothetical protein
MDVTAKTDKGSVVTIGRKEYREVGLDLNGNERLGAWQIKQIIDLSLPPGKVTRERFVTEFPEGTESADIEVVLRYFHSPTSEILVHKIMKKVRFGA